MLIARQIEKLLRAIDRPEYANMRISTNFSDIFVIPDWLRLTTKGQLRGRGDDMDMLVHVCVCVCVCVYE